MLLFNFKCSGHQQQDLHFNTSNVTIQQGGYMCYWLIMRISIHLMLLFNFQFGTAIKAPLMISIHLMLLFNNDGNITGAVIKRISIHLMLLFNAFIPVMLLVITYFNTSNVTIQPLLARIAASLFPISIHLMLLFNKWKHNYNYRYNLISIHLMLLFNLLAGLFHLHILLFQYI